jgi:gamma-glutamylcyclotransferase
MRFWTFISQAFLAPQFLTSPLATSLSQTAMADTTSNRTIYFGYGSNLWRHQMSQRCPESQFQGIARLNDYKWLINERGYANVVQFPSSDQTSVEIAESYEHEVWGLVYTLQPEDEARLDRNEGVPVAYTKEVLECDFWAVEDGSGPANVAAKPRRVGMLVYINRRQVEAGQPKEEYVYRMNRGIGDAVGEGVPKGYVEGVLRRFISE